MGHIKGKLLRYIAIILASALFYSPNSLAQNLKRGLAISTNSSTGTWYENVSNSNSNWFYTWGTTIPDDQASNIPANSDFVPMFWGTGNVTTSNINKLSDLKNLGEISYILGFNEPDLSVESNITVERALELWPQLESIGVPLASPATSYPRLSEGSWFTTFMDSAIAQGRRVDYIAVHMYAGSSPDTYINQLQKVWDRYHLPIWLTEFAVRDDNANGDPDRNNYTPEMILSFMKGLLPRLDTAEYIYRYSWFHPSPTMAGLFPCALFNQDGSLTILGGYYKSLDTTRTDDTPPIITFNTPRNNLMTTNTNLKIDAIAFDIDSGTNDGDGIDTVVFDIMQGTNILASKQFDSLPYTWNLDLSDYEYGSYNIKATVSSTSDTGVSSSSTTHTILFNSSETSISHKKASSASSEQAGNSATNANDGSTSTRWAASSGSFPQWWKVDLGAVGDLTFADIYWYNGASRAYKYIIEVSNDDENYTTVVDKSSNSTMTIKTTDNIDISARYIKVTISGTSDGWASMLDVQIFGNITSTIPNGKSSPSQGLHLFPNPTKNGNTTIHIADDAILSYAEIHDLRGIFNFKREFYGNTLQLNNLKNGIYLVKISNKMRTETTKLIVN